MPPAPVIYRLDKESHCALWNLIFWRSVIRCLLWIIPLSALAGLLLTVGREPLVEALVPILAGVVGGSVAVAAMWLTIPHRAAKVFNESAILQEQFTLSVDDQEFEFTQESGNVRSRWDQMAKWDEDGRLLAIFPNRQMAYLLPKDRVPQGFVDYCRERLIASGLPLPNRLRK